jgi:GNAT superfamily N-acetyltransferase
MIRPCDSADFEEIRAIINDAAQAYRGAIPAGAWHEPYMSAAALASEIADGVRFFGWEESCRLLGVMGVQPVCEVTLIRHAYVRTVCRRQGIGGALLDFLAERTSGPLLVGTWAAAEWAIRFYEKHGFAMAPGAEKDRLLDSYWTISPQQRDASVVLTRPARTGPRGQYRAPIR